MVIRGYDSNVLINLNPYQGLKQQKTRLPTGHRVLINLNPYQGLKLKPKLPKVTLSCFN